MGDLPKLPTHDCSPSADQHQKGKQAFIVYGGKQLAVKHVSISGGRSRGTDGWQWAYLCGHQVATLWNDRTVYQCGTGGCSHCKHSSLHPLCCPRRELWIHCSSEELSQCKAELRFPPTERELECAVKKVGSLTAPGCDGIPKSLVKVLGSQTCRRVGIS